MDIYRKEEKQLVPHVPAGNGSTQHIVHVPGGGERKIAMAPVEDLSSGELVKLLSIEAKSLVRDEVELAKAELAGVSDRAAAAGISLAIGGAALFVALLTGAATAILLLALVLPAWAAAMIVFVTFLAVGVLVTVEGVSKIRKLREKPKAALALLENDARWFQRLVQHFRAIRTAY